MRLFCSVILATALLTGCTKKPVVIPPVKVPVGTVSTAPTINFNDSVSYLALGDSYTYGVGAPQNLSYPFQLASQLRSLGYLAKDPAVVAFEGWTAGDLLAALSAKKITSKFDFVTILIGVNDQNKGTDLTLYTTQLDNLITEAIAYAGGHSSRVFVISIPDWWVTPFAAGMDTSLIMNGVTRFNTINSFESERLGATYIDITAISEKAATDPTLTCSDGLHPSAKGYALWVSQIQGSIVIKKMATAGGKKPFAFHLKFPSALEPENRKSKLALEKRCLFLNLLS
jgi:lysophospholipase L1-like esterase